MLKTCSILGLCLFGVFFLSDFEIYVHIHRGLGMGLEFKQNSFMLHIYRIHVIEFFAICLIISRWIKVCVSQTKGLQNLPSLRVQRKLGSTAVHTCDRGASAQTEWHVSPVASCHLVFFFNSEFGAFQILSFRLGLLILNSPVLGSTFHEYHGELNVNWFFPLPQLHTAGHLKEWECQGGAWVLVLWKAEVNLRLVKVKNTDPGDKPSWILSFDLDVCYCKYQAHFSAVPAGAAMTNPCGSSTAQSSRWSDSKKR